MKVSARAFSVFCPHCQKRAPLESLRIVGSHPGKTLATCGDIFIEATANLNLSITAENVVVNGRVRGPVAANQTVEVGPTGQVYGDIIASKIVVRDGAVIEGRCEMVSQIATSPEPTLSSAQRHSVTVAPKPPESNRREPHTPPAQSSATTLGPLPPPPRKVRPSRHR